MVFECQNPQVMKRYFFVCAVALFLSLLNINLSADGNLAFQSDRMDVHDGWEYRWGSSPLDESGIPEWCDSNEELVWAPADQIWSPPGRKSQRELWLRIKLPRKYFKNPVMQISAIDQAVDIYYKKKNIYAFGSIDNLMSAFSWHLVELPDEYSDDYMYFRIRSVYHKIGIIKKKIVIGEASSIISMIIRNDIYAITSSFIFVLLGVISFTIFIFSFRKTKLWPFLSFGFFAFSLGVYTLARTQAKQLMFFNNPDVWGFVELSSLYLVPVGIDFFLKIVFKPSKRDPIYWLPWVASMIGVGFVISGIFNHNNLMLLLPSFQYFLLVNLVLVIGYSIYVCFKRLQYSLVFTSGIVVMGGIALTDLFQEFGIILKHTFHTFWGLLFFIVVLIYILSNMVGKMYRDIRIYSTELEAKNLVIEQSHKELEGLYTEIEITQREVIYRLSEVAEARSKETGNHVRRVAEYTRIIAEGYGLTIKDINILKLAAPMHDIGKLGIPDSILNKPGKLTEEEFEIIKTHTIVGYEMLNKSERDIFSAAALVAYQHHEKFDGTGYPNGIAGNDIHIYGRITAVADVFDSLASDRCYKKAWELGQILEFFTDQKGKHFDPVLVDILMQKMSNILIVRDHLVDEV